MRLLKQFRHFLFDHKGLVCVLDAGDDLKREINFYNAFDRFYGAVDNISDCLVILENVLDELRRRKKEVFDAEGNFDYMNRSRTNQSIDLWSKYLAKR